MSHIEKAGREDLTSTISLAGVVAVITGAGSPPASGSAGQPLGIGAATALHFAKSGAAIVVVDRDEDAAARTADLITRSSPECVREGRMLVTNADVTSEADTVAVARSTLDAFGPISALVNNVGIAGPRGTAIEVDLDEWSSAMETNVGSMLLMSRAVLPQMISAEAGSIINMSSLAGLRGGHHSLSYPTTKAAVIGLTKAMAAHHGHQGVRVNAIVPGLVYTPMVSSRGLSPESRRLRREASMLKTEGTAWDVASTAAFLASDASRWTTGTALPIDGGLGSLVSNLGVEQSAGE